MRVYEAILTDLCEDRELAGVPRAIVKAVAEATLRHAAAWCPAGFELSEADAAEVEYCVAPRCKNFIDSQNPGDDAHPTKDGDGYLCDACYVEERGKAGA